MHSEKTNTSRFKFIRVIMYCLIGYIMLSQQLFIITDIWLYILLILHEPPSRLYRIFFILQRPNESKFHNKFLRLTESEAELNRIEIWARFYSNSNGDLSEGETWNNGSHDRTNSIHLPLIIFTSYILSKYTS